MGSDYSKILSPSSHDEDIPEIRLLAAAVPERARKPNFAQSAARKSVRSKNHLQLEIILDIKNRLSYK